jgi:hypothetical protein
VRVLAKPLVICAGLLVFAWLPSALAADSPPAKDRFSGTVTGGTGAYRHATGHAAIVVRISDARGRSAHISLVFRAGHCARSSCLELSGRLAGTATAKAQPADAGRAADLSVEGNLTGLGHVSVTGTLHGTGFTQRGQETLDLQLRAGRGTLKVHAHSDDVPGFSFPA